MARARAGSQDYDLLLKRNDELARVAAAAQRRADRDEVMLRHVRLASKRVKPVAHEFFNAQLHRSPYLCQCNQDDPHRKIWVKNGKLAVLHCPFVVICNMGKLELRGYGKVPIEQIVELSKV